ncbi:unnamed protein product [Lactuca saligna]|uniref:Uncharacterized protein n=1 Tax=Lactuca saligna TaxID=75948 RepID=A0AA35YLC8_LACSI|nr:unnamed protein product [Lactuca saligna]
MIIQFLFTIILLQSFLFHGIQFQYQVQLIISGVQSVLYPFSNLANYIPSNPSPVSVFNLVLIPMSLVEAFDRTVGLHSTWNEIVHKLVRMVKSGHPHLIRAKPKLCFHRFKAPMMKPVFRCCLQSSNLQ